MANTPSWLGKDDTKEEFRQKGAWVSWGKVGDGFKGILIGREMRDKKNMDTGEMERQEVYEFYMLGGEFHTLDAKKNPIEPGVTIKEGDKYFCGDSLRVGNGMRNARLGDECVILFEREDEPPKKGYNPVKIVNVWIPRHHADWVKRTSGNLEPEALAEKPDIMDDKFGA